MGAAAAAAAVGAVGAIGSGIMQAGAAKKAGDVQAQAAREAAQLQQDQYNQTREDLLPYMKTGNAALPALGAFPGQAQTALTGAYNAAQGQLPVNITSDQLLKGPAGEAYRFNLEQGLKATANSNAGKGWGSGGEALKGAANFATGLASNQYQNVFNNQNQIFQDYNQMFSNMYNQQNLGYNQLYQTAGLGENAAAKSGSIGQAGAAAAGTNIAGAGQAQAAGIASSGKAIGNAISNVANVGSNALYAADNSDLDNYQSEIASARRQGTI